MTKDLHNNNNRFDWGIGGILLAVVALCIFLASCATSKQFKRPCVEFVIEKHIPQYGDVTFRRTCGGIWTMSYSDVYRVAGLDSIRVWLKDEYK